MRSIHFTDLQENMSVLIISNDEQQYLLIERLLPNGEYIVDSCSGSFRNATILSENLRDGIGYGPARDMLMRHGVEESDPLMTLGRKG